MKDLPGAKLSAKEIAEVQHRKLIRLLDEVRASNPFYREKWNTAPVISNIRDLSSLPFTTRSEIERDQSSYPPYGSDLTYPLANYVRLHQTSGTSGTPVRWLDTPESWQWWKKCWAWVYHGADVSRDDRFLFAFSFGPFIGFWSAFETAVDLGSFVLTAGGLTSLARLHLLFDHRITAICCTPTYALRLAEVAAENGLDLRNSCVTKLIVAGEPGGSIPGVRARIEDAWNARVFDHAGMTEIGAWGYECAARASGLHVIETEFIPEVIDPQSTAAVPEGQSGELVLTNLGRRGSPLIRYRTGDLVRLTRGTCDCGSAFARLDGGVLGRVDSMLIIRGNNVFPSAIEDFVRSFPQIAEFNLLVYEDGPLKELELILEPKPGADGSTLIPALESAFRNRFHFAARITTVASGVLPRFDMKARRVIRREKGAARMADP